MAKTRFTTPVGRMVQGDVDEPQTKDQQGNPRVIKSGPNAGQPNPQYYVGVAVAKNDPAWPAFWAILVNQAVADFPNLFPYGAQPLIDSGGPIAALFQPPTQGGQPFILHPKFTFKVLDGDGWDSNGKPNNQKEGFAGHWVVRCASAYPPKCFHAGHYAPHEQIQEKKAVRRGYFVRVNGSADGNGNAQNPGLYVNLDMVELSAYGQEIVSGPDANEAFGGGPAALPAGATPAPQTPAAPVAAPPVGNAPAPAAPVSPPAVSPAPVSPPVPAPAPAAPVAAPAPAAPVAPPAQPYAGYMDPQAGGAAPAANPAPPAAPTPPLPTAAPTSPVMSAAAGGFTYEQMLAAGWTDDTLRANGMFA